MDFERKLREKLQKITQLAAKSIFGRLSGNFQQNLRVYVIDENDDLT